MTACRPNQLFTPAKSIELSPKDSHQQHYLEHIRSRQHKPTLSTHCHSHSLSLLPAPRHLVIPRNKGTNHLITGHPHRDRAKVSKIELGRSETASWDARWWRRVDTCNHEGCNLHQEESATPPGTSPTLPPTPSPGPHHSRSGQ